jgi:hypothetical protein
LETIMLGPDCSFGVSWNIEDLGFSITDGFSGFTAYVSTKSLYVAYFITKTRFSALIKSTMK